MKGRLKPQVSIGAAAAEASAIARALEQAHPETNRQIAARVISEIQTRLEFIPGAGLQNTLLLCTTFVVLLIACANVANLMLSRGQDRAREIAVRLAIGANRARLVRLLMTESLLIAFAGGALGSLIAESAVQILSTVEVPSDIPIQLSFQLDGRVLWFTALAAAASAVVFGLLPALQSTKTVGLRLFDPLVFGPIAAGLLLTTLVAAAIPAYRASRIDPMQALRED